VKEVDKQQAHAVVLKDLDKRLKEQQVHEVGKPTEQKYAGDNFEVGSIIPAKEVDKRLKEQQVPEVGIEQKYAGDKFEVGSIIPAKEVDMRLKEQVGKPTEKYAGDNFEVGSVIPAKEVDMRLKEMEPGESDNHGEQYHGDKFDASKIIPVKDLDARLQEQQPIQVKKTFDVGEITKLPDSDRHEGIGHEFKGDSGDKLKGTKHTNEFVVECAGDKIDVDKIKTEAPDERHPKDTTEIVKDQDHALAPEESHQKRFSLGGMIAKVKHMLNPKDSQDVAQQGIKQTTTH
jgi:hypothetical protein